MATVLVIHYDTSTNRYYGKQVAGTEIVDGAIISAKIASGAVGDAHIYPDAVTTAKILDANVTSAKLTSAIVSLLGSVADGAIISAKLASGIVGSVHLADEAVKSGDIAANIIATPHILDQGILSASIGTNIIATPHIVNQGILSASIGANAIGDAHIANYGITSGKYASGSVTEAALASGISIDIAEIQQEPSYRAQGPISSFHTVQFSVSGYFNYAQAADISSMPAIGLAVAGISSGQLGTFQYGGRIANALWNFSGYVGRLVFTGTSGEVRVSGPALSGECIQRIGKVVGYDTIFLAPEMTFMQLEA